jgi:hypothetical protein
MTKRLLIVFAGIASAALLLAAAALLVHLMDRRSAPGHGGVAVHDPAAAPMNAGGASVVRAARQITPPGGASAAGGKRFTLRLGQGFRFKDNAVVVADKAEPRPDIVFKYLPPHIGGLATRYNPISQQVETGLEPTLTAPLPLLLAAHVNAFDNKPDVARITSGDAAGYFNQATIAGTTRYLLLMNDAGEQYLLTLDEFEAPSGNYDAWRISFAYEPVQLPLGSAGGQISKPLPGRIIFRDWYQSKMIVSADLTTGKETALVDGILPTAIDDRLLAYGDSSSAYVLRDVAAGKILRTIRFNEQILGPVLSPDGTRLAGSVYRPGPEKDIGGVKLPGAPVLSVAVFDLDGREIVSILGYDDAVWTPDGKRLVATGALYDPGLFEIDPAARSVMPIDAQVASPFQPCVSPDGKTVAFVTGDKVWLIDRDGKNLRQLFPHGTKQQRPAFSPDGSMIAMIVCNHLGNDTTGDVFVVDLKTQEITPLRTNTGSSLVPDTSTRLNWIR